MLGLHLALMYFSNVRYNIFLVILHRSVELFKNSHHQISNKKYIIYNYAGSKNIPTINHTYNYTSTDKKAISKVVIELFLFYRIKMIESTVT